MYNVNMHIEYVMYEMFIEKTKIESITQITD